MKTSELTDMLKRLGWMLGVLGVAAVVVSAVEEKNASLTRSVEVEIYPLPDSTMLITHSDVLSALDRSFDVEMEGRPIRQVNVERVERILEEDPLVKDADAFLDAENRLQIRVWQRPPVLRIMDDNGLNYYLDAGGMKMPLSRHYTARVMVATGNIPPHVPDFLERERHLLKDVFLINREISDDPFLAAMISQIHMEQNGEITLIPMVGDQLIYFGRYERAAEKFKNLKLFYKEAMPYEGWRKYRTINLKFKGQVVCK